MRPAATISPRRRRSATTPATPPKSARPCGDGEGLETLRPGAAPSESKGWIGERFDPETGLLHLNARYYDPVLARFIQPDWWDPDEPGVGTNRYAYALNDPVNLSDPSGHVAVVGAVVGGIVGFGYGVVSESISAYNSGEPLSFEMAGDILGEGAVGSAIGVVAGASGGVAYGAVAANGGRGAIADIFGTALGGLVAGLFGGEREAAKEGRNTTAAERATNALAGAGIAVTVGRALDAPVPTAVTAGGHLEKPIAWSGLS